MKQTVLITGGSSGIGLELARLFARDDYRLVLVSKPPEELARAKTALEKEIPGVEVITHARDLSEAGAAKAVYTFTRERDLRIDVLVNNAGFGTYGFIADIDPEQELAMIQLHVATLYHLSRLFLADMIDRDRGHIVNLSSISAFQPNPRLATYGATKSFVLQWSRAVNYELRERGSAVRVLVVCPTPVKDTGFETGAGLQKTRLFDNWMVVTPPTVARAAYRAMQQGKEMVIPGRGFGLLRSLVGRLPSGWMMRYSAGHLKETL